MDNQWKNRPDIAPDFDPNEIIEDAYKHYTYQELFNFSKSLDENQILKCKKWNQVSVSSFDSYEQIFYDIANSKKVKRIYIKTSIISIIFCFIKLLPLFYLIFVSYGLITSKFNFFLIDMLYWKLLLIPTMLSFILNHIIEYCFLDYLPTNETGKIDTSYKGNKTSHTNIESVGVNVKFSPYSHRMMLRPMFFVKSKKPKFIYRYSRYVANNNKEYLIDINAEGRYYSIRNWYLISKYITLDKMKTSDLDKHFEDELFVYLTTSNFKKEKLKLRSFFNKKFSLYFMSSYSDWLTIIYFSITPIFSGILCLSIW